METSKLIYSHVCLWCANFEHECVCNNNNIFTTKKYQVIPVEEETDEFCSLLYSEWEPFAVVHTVPENRYRNLIYFRKLREGCDVVEH